MHYTPFPLPDIYQKANCVLTGSWYSNSPVMLQYLRNYLDMEQGNLHLIIYNQGTEEKSCTVQFLQEKTGKVAELVERFTVSHGGEYLVYGFRE